VYVAACIWRAPDVTGEVRGALGRRRHKPRLESLDGGLIEA
jgi:hypothetical protein